ncbi:uncharacterized protein LOC116938987 [Petromyzon marinus]|uniref:uncharacterized protein LOC116938987 n=1 Tax=Petromyzon marinus TaxID=7757 RepID=UPI003F6FAA10
MATASSSAAVSAAEAERGAADGLDPRIKEELEKLNQASEEINELEVKLTATRAEYCRVLSESAKKLNVCATKLGSCVERARPYYEARRQAKEAQAEAQRAALRYERAVSMHAAAREMVCVAEQGLACRGGTLDPAWQEMLNHATIKVNDAEADRLHSEREHQSRALRSQNAERHLQQLASSLRRVVMKSRPYFTLKATLGAQLEENKSNVTSLEKKARDAKARYAAALRSLEKISEEMHKERQLRPQQQRKQPSPQPGQLPTKQQEPDQENQQIKQQHRHQELPNDLQIHRGECAPQTQSRQQTQSWQSSNKEAGSPGDGTASPEWDSHDPLGVAPLSAVPTIKLSRAETGATSESGSDEDLIEAVQVSVPTLTCVPELDAVGEFYLPEDEVEEEEAEEEEKNVVQWDGLPPRQGRKHPERSVRDVLGAEGQAMPPRFRDGSEGGTTRSLAALNALRSDADLEFALSFHAAESELALPPDAWPEPDGDSLSLGSLRSFASDLQKCDSVDHLAGLADTLSLCGSDGAAGPRAGSEGRRGTATAVSTEAEAQAAAAAGGSALWVRGSSKQHQRSISM